MSTLLPLLLTLVLAGPGATDEPAHAFAVIDGHYQSIRVTLLQDSTKEVRENAAAIAKAAETLQAGLSAEKAGVAEGELAKVKELLPEVIARAKTLAAAEGIGPQREALKKLTQPLVRWHEKLAGAKPRLAYCSMERGAWFQPDGELGNPYGGQRMPRCGTFVTK